MAIQYRPLDYDPFDSELAGAPEQPGGAITMAEPEQPRAGALSFDRPSQDEGGLDFGGEAPREVRQGGLVFRPMDYDPFAAPEAPPTGRGALDFGEPGAPPTPERETPGLLAETGKALARGALVQLPSMIGGALQFAGAEDFGEIIKLQAEDRLEAMPSIQESPQAAFERETSPFALRGALSTAAESAVPSVAPALTGAAIGTAFGPAGTLVGFGAGLMTSAGLFGMAAGQETKERVKPIIKRGLLQQGFTPQQAEQQAEIDANDAGVQAALVEGGGEALSNLVPLGIAKALPAPVRQNLVGSITSFFRSPKDLVKGLAATLAAEEATEIGQTAGQIMVESLATSGYEDAIPSPTMEDISKVILPTAIMSLAFFGAGEVVGGVRRRQLANALKDPTRPQEEREAAVATVYNHINETGDRELADMWLDAARPNLEGNRPIAFDTELENELNQKREAVNRGVGAIDISRPPLGEEEDITIEAPIEMGPDEPTPAVQFIVEEQVAPDTRVLSLTGEGVVPGEAGEGAINIRTIADGLTTEQVVFPEENIPEAVPTEGITIAEEEGISPTQVEQSMLAEAGGFPGTMGIDVTREVTPEEVAASETAPPVEGITVEEELPPTLVHEQRNQIMRELREAVEGAEPGRAGAMAQALQEAGVGPEQQTAAQITQRAADERLEAEQQRARGRPFDRGLTPKERQQRLNRVEPRDNMATAIAKLGGIDLGQAKSFGIDPTLQGYVAPGMNAVAGRMFKSKNAGALNLDQMAELLREREFDVETEADMADALHDIVNQGRVILPANMAAAEQEFEKQARERERYGAPLGSVLNEREYGEDQDMESRAMLDRIAILNELGEPREGLPYGEWYATTVAEQQVIDPQASAAEILDEEIELLRSQHEQRGTLAGPPTGERVETAERPGAEAPPEVAPRPVAEAARPPEAPAPVAEAEEVTVAPEGIPAPPVEAPPTPPPAAEEAQPGAVEQPPAPEMVEEAAPPAERPFRPTHELITGEQLEPVLDEEGNQVKDGFDLVWRMDDGTEVLAPMDEVEPIEAPPAAPEEVAPEPEEAPPAAPPPEKPPAPPAAPEPPAAAPTSPTPPPAQEPQIAQELEGAGEFASVKEIHKRITQKDMPILEGRRKHLDNRIKTAKQSGGQEAQEAAVEARDTRYDVMASLRDRRKRRNDIERDNPSFKDARLAGEKQREGLRARSAVMLDVPQKRFDEAKRIGDFQHPMKFSEPDAEELVTLTDEHVIEPEPGPIAKSPKTYIEDGGRLIQLPMTPLSQWGDMPTFSTYIWQTDRRYGKSKFGLDSPAYAHGVMVRYKGGIWVLGAANQLRALPDGSRAPKPGKAPVDTAAEQTETTPSQGQQEAGNYKKGKVRMFGETVSIETPHGSPRWNYDLDRVKEVLPSIKKGTRPYVLIGQALNSFDIGNPEMGATILESAAASTGLMKVKATIRDVLGRGWHVQNFRGGHYGYFLDTVGRDKDHVDVTIKPGYNRETDGERPVYVVDQHFERGIFDEHKVFVGYNTNQEVIDAYLADRPNMRFLNRGWVVQTNEAELKEWLHNPNLSVKQSTFSNWKNGNIQAAPQEKPDKATAMVQTARDVHDQLMTGDRFTKEGLFRAAENRFGGTVADGTFLSKEAYDAMELGVNLHVLEHLSKTAPGEARAQVEYYSDFENKTLPTQTVRSQQQERLQQFSTPHAHSHVVAWLANITSSDVVLEPSAGTGNIATHAALYQPAELHVNEIDPYRAAALQTLHELGYATEVHSGDGQFVHVPQQVPARVSPTVIVMNPPFSSDFRQQGKKVRGLDQKHIQSALKKLREGGRLVAITGRGLDPATATGTKFMRLINRDYTMRVNMGIDGRNYRKYGTGFDNRVIVIDKTGPSPNPNSPGVTGMADTPMDVVNDKTRGVRDGRGRPEQLGVPTEGKAGAEGLGDRAGPGRSPRAPTGTPSAGQRESEAQAEGLSQPLPGPSGAGAPGTMGAEAAAGSARGARSDVEREPGGSTGDERPGTSGVSSGAVGRGDRADPRARGRELGKRPASDFADLTEADFDALIDEAVEGQKPTATTSQPEAKAQAKQGGRKRKAAVKEAGAKKRAAKRRAKPPKPNADQARSDLMAVVGDDPDFKDVLDAAGEGFTESLVGLAKLFGVNRKGTFRSGLGFDEETYQEALPHFQASLEAFVRAGKNLAAYFNFLVKAYGRDFAKVYGKRFLEDVKALRVEVQGINDTSLQRDTTELVEGQEQTEEGTFAEYTPRIRFEGAQPHNTVLSESSAMSAVTTPDVSYIPDLPKPLITSGRISSAQLEAVTLAGAAHSQRLRGSGPRRGFFIGDGTGVGKGAQTAAIILDNWRRGRKKAVWISKNTSLAADALRDIKHVGMPPGVLKNLSKMPGETDIGFNEAVMFATYKTLTSETKKLDEEGKQIPGEGRKRIDQLVEWLGEDFDGVIAFDESHMMRNSVDVGTGRGQKKASKNATAAAELRAKLPNARVVYLSATGATEVTNLAYLDRLGLWGEGTAFSNRAEFLSQIEAGGVASMEVVAQAMKAGGMYVRRELSFKGVDYDKVVHGLTPEQVMIYDEMARTWQFIVGEINQTMKDTNTDKNTSQLSKIRSQMFGAQQRFFNAILTSMQMPSVFEQVDKDLATDHSIVLQLVNTNQATADRRITQANDQGIELDDVEVSPKDVIVEYVEKNFPTKEYAEQVDQEGNSTWVEVGDSPEALQRKEDMLERIGQARIPEGVLELLLSRYQPERVAEFTGRSQRLWWKPDGSRGQDNHTEAKRRADVDAFMDGKKRILVFSDAGGTGKSYHSNLDAKNQQRRAHYLIQPGWRADAAVQGFGRTHRTNQRVPPIYRLVTTNLKGHLRFLSSIARRLEQLGALTTGQRDTANQGIFEDEMNLENEYTQSAVRALLVDVDRASRTPDAQFPGEILRPALFADRMGFVDLFGPRGTGALVNAKIPKVSQFLNRMLMLEISEQNILFDELFTRIQAQVEAAKAAGTYDTGVELIKADRITKKGEEEIRGTGASMVELEIETTARPIDWDQVMSIDSQMASKTGKTGNLHFGESIKEEKGKRRFWAFTEGVSIVDQNTGDVIQRVRRIGPTAITQMSNQEAGRKYRLVNIPMSEAKQRWEQQLADTSMTRVRTENWVTGNLLQVWDRLAGTGLKIYRATTDQGEGILGRPVPRSELRETRRNLGLEGERIDLQPHELHGQVLEGASFKLANGYVLRRSRVGGENRIEVKDGTKPPSMSDANLLKSQGAFAERIQYNTRIFIPTDASGVDTIERIIANSPVVEQLTDAKPVVEAPAPQLETRKEPAEAAKRNETLRERLMSALRSGQREREQDAQDLELPKLVGSAVPSLFADQGRVKLRGRVFNTEADLAALAQIYRNPMTETFRVIYVKDRPDGQQEVVGQTGVTARLPGLAPAYLGGEDPEFSLSGEFRRMGEEMAALGADGYYVMHNHPNGNSAPSQPDIDLTRQHGRIAPERFRGHVVLNSDEFTFIDERGEAETTQVDFAKQYGIVNWDAQGAQPRKSHPMVGSAISSAQDIARMGKEVQRPEASGDYFVLFSVAGGKREDGLAEVRGVMEVPTAYLRRHNQSRLNAMLRRFSRQTGGTMTFAAEVPVAARGMLTESVRQGFLTDGMLRGRAASLRTVDRHLDADNYKNLTFGAEVPRSVSVASPGPKVVFSRIREDNQDRIERAQEAVQGFLDPIRRRIQDDMIYVRRKIEHLRAAGAEVGDDANVYDAATRWFGRTDERLRKFREDFLQPTLDLISERGLTVDQVEDYLYARHAPERNRLMAQRNPKFADKAGSGMTDDEAAAIIRQAGDDGLIPALDEIASKIDDVTAWRVDYLVEQGLLTPEAAESWRKQFDFYVPLRGHEGKEELARVGKGFDVRGPESKQALGRRSRANHLLAYVFGQAEESIVRAEKNKVDQALLQLVRQNPELGTVRSSLPGDKPKIKFKPGLDENGEITFEPNPFWTLNENIVAAKVDGEQVYIEVDDPDIARAMRRFGGAPANALVNALGKFNRFLAMMTTSLNPEFILTNFARDMQTAFINIAGEDSAKMAKAVMGDVKSAVRGIYRQTIRRERGRLPEGEPETKWEKEFQEFRQEGGQTGFFGLKSIEDKQREIRNLISRANPGKLNTVKRAFVGVLEYVQDVNGVAENAARLSAYVHMRDHLAKQYRKDGMSEEQALRKARRQAAVKAKNLTVNFNRRGEWGVFLNSFWLFYNASIQGAVRTIQALKHPKVQKIAAGIVGFAIGMDILNRMISGEDDNGEDYYDQIPEWVRRHNLIIMDPFNEGQYYKIPLPYGYNVLHVLGQNFAATMMGARSPIDAAQDIVASAFESFNPLGGAPTLTQYMAPTVMEPIIAHHENVNFAGAPIRPSQPQYGPPRPDSQLYWSTANPTLVWLSSELNAITGGNQVRPGFIDVSPETVEHFLEFIGGGSSKFLSKFFNSSARLANGEDLPIKEIPFARRFAGEPAEFFTSQKFRTNVDTVKLLQQELKLFQDADDQEAIARLREEYAPMLALGGMATRTQSAVKRYNQLIRATKRAGGYTEEQKEDRIDRFEELKRQAQSRFNLRVKMAMEQQKTSRGEIKLGTRAERGFRADLDSLGARITSASETLSVSARSGNTTSWRGAARSIEMSLARINRLIENVRNSDMSPAQKENLIARYEALRRRALSAMGSPIQGEQTVSAEGADFTALFEGAVT